MDRANQESNVTSAKKTPDFKSIACSGKLLQEAVVHNMELLKTLHSDIKLPIISFCIKNKNQDYVGLRYLDLYDAQRKQQPVEENHVVKHDKKRKSRPDYEDCVIKTKKVTRRATPEIPKPSLECKCLSEDEQENHVTECDEDYVEEEGKCTKTKKNKNIKERPRAIPEIPNPSPEALPEEIKAKIAELNGKNLNWVYTKRLFGTDVALKNNRLSMPKNQIDISFLREDEREFLVNKDGGIVPGIKVGLVGPTGESSTMLLKMWEMRKDSGRINYVYNLVDNWYNGVVLKYGLRNNDLVQVWSFRVGEDLWFALVRVPD